MMEIFRDMLPEACSAIALLDEGASQEAGPHRTSLEAIWPSLEAMIYMVYGGIKKKNEVFKYR